MAVPKLFFVLLILTFANQCYSDLDCTDGWFDCENGICVAEFWRCDGENDCGNSKDEHDCEKGPQKKCLSSQILCLEDNHCIPQVWRCDGQHDCDDGSDELHCENSTRCPGFKCKDNHCVPSEWRCDGRKDCPDGSDEDFCTKELCSEDEFTCSSGACLARNRVCDSKKDCLDASDESKDCGIFCNTTKCSQKCRQTPRGPECFCNSGYKLGKDNKACEDINECSTEGFCSQICSNIIGSYKCSCLEGYELVNRTCQASGADPILIFSTLTEIRGMHLRSKRYFPVQTALTKASSVDVDPLESKVYWVEISNKTTIYSSNLDGTGYSTVLSTGLQIPEGIAVDYIARNLYFTDSGLKQILACKIDGSMCHTLHSSNVGKPRAISLDIPEGLMYWSDWGENTTGIYRSGMDGTRRVNMVSKDIKWPNGIAIDHTSNRLYWSDAKLLTIEYITLDGKTRKVLLKNEVFHPYSLAVFEDHLYWSDWQSFSLESSNKFTGHETTVIGHENGKRIMGIHVYHPVLARRASNPCWGNICSHMCLIGPFNSHRCACPPSFNLDSNGRTCSIDKNFPMLLVNDESNIYHIRPEVAGSIAVSELPISHIGKIGRMACDWKSKTLFVTDMSVPVIYSINMTSLTRRELVKSHLMSPEGIAFDSQSRNLYWVDSSKGTVEVISVASQKLSIIIDNLAKPEDISLVSSMGLMFVSFIDDSPLIRMYDMDGKNGKMVNGVFGLPMALAVHPSASLLYWADPRMGAISSIDYLIPRSEETIEKSGIANVMSIAVNENYLYWTDSKRNAVSFKRHNESFPHVISLPGATRGIQSRRVIYAAAPVSKRSLGNQVCSINNGGCSYLCLTSPAGRSCSCPLGRKLGTDGATCKDKECNSDEFKCQKDGRCILKDYLCDGVKDCSDNSDEDCEGKRSKCPNNDFRCTNGQCVVASWKCDGMDDCGDGSDEANCPPRANCSSMEFSCGSGECIPLLWRCDHTNDCKDHSDENECQTTACSEGQLRCGHGQCIPLSWACDGAHDCIDGTDEKNCSVRKHTCNVDQFHCKHGLCIDKALVCDSRKDCEDGSDEENCSQKNVTCEDGHYACNDNVTCIYLHEVCDGYKDCTTGEDEKNCTNAYLQCTDEEYFCNTSRCISKRWLCDGDDDCGGGEDELLQNCLDSYNPIFPTVCNDYVCPLSEECISWEKVCDGEHDCNDLQDEGPMCSKSCFGGHGECSHKCQKTPQGSRCLCFEGYILMPDEVSCEDLNECEVPGSCSHFCNNTKGGFKCSCAEGFILEFDHKTCKAEGERPSLIYLLPDEIRGIDLDTYSQQVYTTRKSSDMRGLDYDVSEKIFYWADWKEKTINRYIAKEKHQDVLLHTPVRPHFLRRDWITKNIYYTDDNGDIICCREDGKYCTTVIKEAAPHVNSFEISPTTSHLFWSVWVLDSEGFGHLVRADMDGSNRTVIISDRTFWPTALTVDHILKMVYWTDIKLSVMECADFNGLNRRSVAEGDMNHPFSMAVFEDYVYWSEWSSDSLIRSGKFDQARTTIHRRNVKAEVMLIDHKAAQPRGTNRCANSQCPHICLPNHTSFVCKCDDHFLPVKSNCEMKDIADISIPESRVKQSCPADYCFQNADCVAIGGRYYCNCSSSYKGERCEVKFTAAQEAYDYSWVVSVVLAILFICLVVVLTFLCRKNSDKITKFGESVAVGFRNAGLSRRGSRLIDECEDGASDELDLSKKPSKSSSFGNPLFGKKSQKLVDPDPQDLKRWHLDDPEDSAFETEPSAGSGFRIGSGPRTATDRVIQFFRR